MGQPLLYRKDTHFFVGIILLNIVLIVLRMQIGDPARFSGNMVTTLVFIGILGWLLYFLLTNKYDRYIMLWLSFYFAAPIIKISYTSIGSLGLMNLILIPLMVLKSFDLRNRYMIVIIITSTLTLFNAADIGARLFLSRLMNFIALPVFYYFVVRKCRDPGRIMGMAVMVALINIPFAIYQYFTAPSWGVFVDWRGTRVFGNLYWPNSYALYLIGPILYCYHLVRTRFRPLQAIILAALLLGMALSFSRAGFAVLFASLVVLEMSTHIRFFLKPKFYVSVLIALAVGALFMSHYAENPRLGTDALSERTSIWDSIYPFMEDNLVMGNGVGSYEIFRDKFLHSLSSHNEYITIIFETGFIGLFLVLVYLFLIFRDIRLGRKHSNKLVPLGYALLTALMIDSLVSESPFSQVVALNLWVMLACIVKQNEKD